MPIWCLNARWKAASDWYPASSATAPVDMSDVLSALGSDRHANVGQQVAGRTAQVLLKVANDGARHVATLSSSVSTTDGKFATIKAGPLLFLDRNGNVIPPSPFTMKLDGPWDLTIDDEFDHARVFVSNVLNGTVTRLDLAITASTLTVKAARVIASRYTSQENDAALILGPTGLAYHPEDDVLFVASTADNTIFAVPQAGSRTGSAGRGTIILQGDHLRGPLALVFASNGNLLTANGDAVNDDPTQPSEIVKFTRTGRFVRQLNVDAAEGGAFGIGIGSVGALVRFAVVDDNAADLTVTDRKSPAHPDD
jgi:hypothetical protein